MIKDVFAPFLTNTRAVSVSASTASGALNLPTSTPIGPVTARIYNATSVVVFIKFGDSTVTAATTDIPIPPGAVEVFSVGGATHVAGITASGTGTLYATAGFGA